MSHTSTTKNTNKQTNTNINLFEKYKIYNSIYNEYDDSCASYDVSNDNYCNHMFENQESIGALSIGHFW